MIAFLNGYEPFIILGVIVLLFGSAQVPKLARNLGKAQKEFKDGLDEGKAEAAEAADDEKSSADS